MTNIKAYRKDGSFVVLSREAFLSRENEFDNHHDTDEITDRESAIKEGKEQKNYPITQIAISCNEAMAKGAIIHQKWTCLNPNCGARQTMEKPNTLFTSGKCEECNEISSISECNFTAIFPPESNIDDIMSFIQGEKEEEKYESRCMHCGAFDFECVCAG